MERLTIPDVKIDEKTTLTAVQLLGQQMLSTWNTMQGHRKKAVAKNPDNAAPLEAFLRQLVKTMEGSIDGTAG